ncbi:MAG: DUF3108 domain-containing protein [Gammaproteobacteria bacterium]|nr:DUF3108 domain-containing protein [Gammaproteobacteria bacterium]MCB1818153.1 DUF3108 domain-containing protein [Gammaproteobacteria bacterium]
MLRLIRCLACAASPLALLACTPVPQAPLPDTLGNPLAVEAGYRLLFNDTLVGNAFFALRIDADHSYVLEALTTPAGKMEQAAGHEILESSRGNVDGALVQPEEFTHSVIDGEHIKVERLLFDWDKRLLRRIDGEATQTVSLQPGTHDRLSYLLAARHLASAAGDAVEIEIASPRASEKTRLELQDAEPIEVPAGRFRALGITRATAENGETRSLWFDVEASPLPLRVSHSWDGNTVEMVLETLSQVPGDPH